MTSVSEIPAPHFDCKAQEAISIDVGRFTRSPELYLGRCIRARGYRWSDSLYPDLETMYALKGDTRGEIQLHLHLKTEEDYRAWLTFQRTREYGEAVGLAYTCEEVERRDAKQFEVLQAEAKSRGEFLIVADGGTCQHINVPRGRATLFVSSWRSMPGMPLSLIGEEAAQKYGDLSELDDGWQYAGEVKRIVQQWFDAVRTRDEVQFASLHPARESEIHELLTSERSPVKFLFGAPARPVKYFRIKFVLPDQPRPVEIMEPVYQALGCVCKAADCSSLWPITTGDANSGFWNDLPYICVHLVRRDSDDGSVSIVSDYFDE